MTPAKPSAHDYEGENDAHHLIEAHAIGKNPKRMKKARGHISRIEKESRDKMIAAKAAKGLKKAFPGD